MNHLHQRQPSQAPKPPAGVVQVAVQFSTPPPAGATPALQQVALASSANGYEAPRLEWFIQGTQQGRFGLADDNSNAASKSAQGKPGAQASARISSPANGTIIALDPDIPPTRQRLSLQAEGNGLRWLMDGKPLAQGNSAQWLPWPGRHVVQLLSASGEKLDEIRIEVRGAGVRASP
jgi:penicillin-binding protein 1C